MTAKAVIARFNREIKYSRAASEQNRKAAAYWIVRRRGR